MLSFFETNGLTCLDQRGCISLQIISQTQFWTLQNTNKHLTTQTFIKILLVCVCTRVRITLAFDEISEIHALLISLFYFFNLNTSCVSHAKKGEVSLCVRDVLVQKVSAYDPPVKHMIKALEQNAKM